MNMTENPKTKKNVKREEKNLRSDYSRSLNKWLKVVLGHYDDLKSKVDKQAKRIEELENTVNLIREKLENISKGEVDE